jgi:hypothetical protein
VAEELDGLLTFFASHHAIRAEKTLRVAGFAVVLIPGPKELSPNCGVAVRFEYSKREDALAMLEAKRVQVDEVHEYRPDTDGWVKPGATETPAKRFWRRGRQ